MKRRDLIKGLAATLPAWYLSKASAGILPAPYAPFRPDWHSLAGYKVPDWYRDAKFGLWAHWGPQCQPEHGDWYARGMYEEGSDDYKFHVAKYGHPSKFGFKDVINEWKAEKWNPDQLVELYKKAGAKYFVALANHHDNFDLYDSKYQSWNSVKMGPKKDLVGGWARAAKAQGLHFGVSVHASHAWRWYETAQRSDKNGPLAGVPYDGNITKTDGKGKWWEGFDPQELYAQHHPLSKDSLIDGSIHGQWGWGNGVAAPSKAYCEKFFRRTIELIDKYQPDLLYFDDTALPLWPVNDAGLRIAAHMYNDSIARHGKLQAVINGKILDEQQRKCMVWDIERGASNSIEPFVWQTDTCIGEWHYDRRVYDQKRYKSAAMVIGILADVVSKNGNLLLNIPVRGDGTIDELELAVVQDIGKWMQVNSEAIYATRPWKVFGEGPVIATAAPLHAQGFNEGKGKPLGAEDFRFTTKGNTLYAIFFGWPDSRQVTIKSLAGNGKPANVTMLGHGDLEWKQTTEGLSVTLPDQRPCDNAYTLKINGAI
ncbi:alpha-L-fucosidase [Flavitalea sp. BT771]|uniref:alpha-L-fucosidase n=1 Tax=Flavitalea sp. BT771 TaxID=3063329 RepID=UPI0026E2B956|nr:alpha-L-fucosidase [Flavitalea sp. BT771]MDO6430284.1 alpha-L-fucosidase [Flavitalea sp. BT771]MDV6219576.1 alpha-L-fucosidase [Flavitalea sp. BT771]